MAINLTEIKEINSIEELAKHYDLIRAYAHQINPQQKEQMEDIVQDTFIKLQVLFEKYPEKVIDGGYVAMTLRSVRLNDKKAYINKMDFGNFLNESIIPDTEDESEITIQTKMDEEILWEKFDELVEDLSWYDRKVLQHSLTMSISELSRNSGIGYDSLRHTMNKNKAKIANIKNK